MTKRGDVWHIRWSEPGPNGKRKQRGKSCKGMSKREAVAELARIQMELEPLQPLTIYRNFRAEVMIGLDPQLGERYPDYNLLEPARLPFLRIREAELGEGVQAVYTVEQFTRDELLIWNKSLSPRERADVLGIQDFPRGIRMVES